MLELKQFESLKRIIKQGYENICYLPSINIID